jgi:hypothetical protein
MGSAQWCSKNSSLHKQASASAEAALPAQPDTFAPQLPSAVLLQRSSDCDEVLQRLAHLEAFDVQVA